MVNNSDLFRKAVNGKMTDFTDYEIKTVINDRGLTPLHIFAMIGDKEILNHPLVSVLKNNFGDTPLHLYSLYCNIEYKEIPSHPDMKNVFNNHLETPFDIFHNN